MILYSCIVVTSNDFADSYQIKFHESIIAVPWNTMTPDADRESGRVIWGQIIQNLRAKFFLIKDFLNVLEIDGMQLTQSTQMESMECWDIHEKESPPPKFHLYYRRYHEL